jgi:hypothetical protein
MSCRLIFKACASGKMRAATFVITVPPAGGQSSTAAQKERCSHPLNPGKPRGCSSVLNASRGEWSVHPSSLA